MPNPSRAVLLYLAFQPPIRVFFWLTPRVRRGALLVLLGATLGLPTQAQQSRKGTPTPRRPAVRRSSSRCTAA
ncbi:MAG: hypothetical protein WKG07_26425 [Hymenobacter sp.]